MSDTAEPPVLVERLGSLGIIRLNRPAVLNSLNLEMVGLIDAALDRFETETGIVALLLEGAGERGLCAGGDIRAIQQSIAAGNLDWIAFLAAEYRLNARIARLALPYVALMDGIVMGGGVGLSAHGRFRIATDRLRLAMPEVGIGFFPDVGASWLLSRPGSELGTYLALTGYPCGAGTAIAAGLANVCISARDARGLTEALAQLPSGSGHDAVEELIARVAKAPDPELRDSSLEMIDRCFAGNSMTEIMDALGQEKRQEAKEIRAWLAMQCPTSLKVTLRLMRAGRTQPDLESCLAMEFTAARHMLVRSDFREGVRAVLVDKDRKPRWQPGDLRDVDDTQVDSWVSPGSGFPTKDDWHARG